MSELEKELTERVYLLGNLLDKEKNVVDSKRKRINALIEGEKTLKKKLRENSQLLGREQKLKKEVVKDLYVSESRLAGRDALIKELYQVIGEDRVQERYLKNQIFDLKNKYNDYIND